ncbi:hypothetical protein DPMN_010115 [Dreissena polymorpha]|uniref:Uncharacterized protein n=3 Tax=Dreissena polymorpha TaxID=45954 RepID=A0A9D4N2J5_DREPO|nr:hypothetical protein DPMN_010115 [Dreissena polymorpha]
MDLRASMQSNAGDVGESQTNPAVRDAHSARSREHRSSADRLQGDGVRIDRLREDGTRPSSGKPGHHVSTNITPVKISRKDLRLMSEEEIKLRRSNLKESQADNQSPHDSLDPGGKNPWS